MVSEIKKEGYEVTGVELKPLDISGYCKVVFEKCNKTLMMSATILDRRVFCRSLGLAHDEVKFIRGGDRWTDAKRKLSRQWYTWQTALRLVQGYSRSVRSKEEWAKTYVLDSAFGPFVNRNKNILPNWFIQAIQA